MSGKVVVFTTGGTIAMRHDPEKGGAVPAVSGAELVAAVPPLAAVCPVDVVEFANIPSPHMTPERMLDLARHVEKALSEPDVLGAVVTHGTDTMEETAYLLDLYIESDKPVCLTGAMRDAAAVGADGPANILAAVRCAAAPGARGAGALVVMNEEIHAARDATKTHAANPKTFASPFWGPLGYADEDAILFCRMPRNRETIRPERLENDVHLIKAVAGMDDFLINCLVEKKAKAIVVEGTGRGNAPPALFAGMKRAVAAGVVVATATRCHGGRVLDAYAYEGGAKQQRDAGVIMAGDLSGPKTRLKLMMALGVTKDPARIAAYF